MSDLMDDRAGKERCTLPKPLLFGMILFASVSCLAVGQTQKPSSDFEAARQAIQRRESATLRDLLDRNQKLIEEKDSKFNATLLHWAALEKDVNSVQLLVNKKASLDTKNNEEAIPLFLAIIPKPNATMDDKRNQEEVVRLLADPKVIDTPAVDGKTALHLAAELGDENIVRLLLELGANANAETKLKKKPWQYAANEQIKRILIDKAKSQTAVTLAMSLHHYAQTGNLNGLKALLQKEGKSIDLNIRNSEGQTPLMVAAKNCHFEVVTYLIKMDADTSVRDSQQRRVWELLCCK
jgi:ankyrin repeat protein